MFSVIMISAAGAIAEVNAENEAFDLKCSFLPKGEADKLRDERNQEMKEKTEHRKRLEIAEAGRTKNFWGN
jgi:hypothetical protein